jgi:hypothetical protein
MSTGILFRSPSWGASLGLAGRIQLVCGGLIAGGYGLSGGLNDPAFWHWVLLLQLPASLLLIPLFFAVVRHAPPCRWDPLWITLALGLPAFVQWGLLSIWFRRPWQR